MPSTLEVAYRQSRTHCSRQRLLVIRLLAESTDHPTAAMLHERARKLDSGIGRTAVSRALAELVDTGLANVIEARRAQYRYEDATLGPHGHMLDVETGELINVGATELEAALSDIARRLGYRLETYRLRLRGHRLAGSGQRDPT